MYNVRTIVHIMQTLKAIKHSQFTPIDSFHFKSNKLVSFCNLQKINAN